MATHEIRDPLALTHAEQDQIVAVLLLTGLITRIDVFIAANNRISAEIIRSASVTFSPPQCLRLRYGDCICGWRAAFGETWDDHIPHGAFVKPPAKPPENATEYPITGEIPDNWRIGAEPWENCRECGQARPTKLLRDGICPRCLMPVTLIPANPLLAH